jgi:hypothetical protein
MKIADARGEWVWMVSVVVAGLLTVPRLNTIKRAGKFD